MVSSNKRFFILQFDHLQAINNILHFYICTIIAKSKKNTFRNNVKVCFCNETLLRYNLETRLVVVPLFFCLRKKYSSPGDTTAMVFNDTLSELPCRLISKNYYNSILVTLRQRIIISFNHKIAISDSEYYLEAAIETIVGELGIRTRIARNPHSQTNPSVKLSSFWSRDPYSLFPMVS